MLEEVEFLARNELIREDLEDELPELAIDEDVPLLLIKLLGRYIEIIVDETHPNRRHQGQLVKRRALLVPGKTFEGNLDFLFGVWLSEKCR